MTFKLYPVPESKINSVIPLIERAHSELDQPKLVTVAQAKRSFAAGYANQSLSAYTDNLDTPRHLLVLSAFPGLLVEGLLAVVHLIYSVPEERGNADVMKAFHTTIENFARFKGAGLTIGSSCVYENSRPIDAMWKSNGYKHWENLWVKEIT